MSDATVQARERDVQQQVVRDGKVRFLIPVVGSGEPLDMEFRVPDLEDLAELDLDFPLLPTEESLEVEGEEPEDVLGKIMSDPQRCIRFMRRCNRLLRKTCISHRVVESLDGMGDGDVFVRAVSSQDRMFTYLVLTGLAGFNQEAAAQVAPFAGTGRSFSPATGSPGGTESGPTKPSEEG